MDNAHGPMIDGMFKVPNPAAPYEGDLPFPFQAGSRLFVRVTVNDDASSFVINFHRGNDILFHFNPRPATGNVAMNSNIDGDWGDEEFIDSMPFEGGNSYGIMIQMQEENYVVEIDGGEFATFQHRTPFEEIDFISVKGDINIDDIIFTQQQNDNGSLPNAGFAVDSAFIRPDPNFFKVPNPRIPYTGDIPNRLVKGKKVVLRVKLKDDCNNFKIDLETPQGIAFHFNPRISSGVIVRNSFFNGEWGSEETDRVRVFEAGSSHGIEIGVEEENFCVRVDGNHVCDFQHRTSFEEVSHISVDGDIECQDIVFAM